MCLKQKPEYAKALVRRGDVKATLKMFEEAVFDYSAAKDLDKDANNVG